MKNKKGESHLGFILSFVIFITFLLFVYTTLEPTLKIRASKQPVLDFLRFSFVDKMESNNTILTITIPDGRTKNCVKVTGNGGDNGKFYDFAKNNKLLIKNETGSKINYTYQGEGGGQILMGIIDSSYIGILKGYNSTALEGSPLYNGGAGCDQVDVTIGSLVEKPQVYESNIISLKDKYDLDCGATLKTELGVPSGNDFTFSFEFANGTIMEPKLECGGIPDTDVYATTFPLEYLDSDANSQIGFLTIKVW